MNNGAEIRGLLRNAPKFLKGLANDPTRMFQSLIEERWLNRRINRPGILDEVAKHALSHPIIHGARVQLPAVEDENFINGT